MHIFTDIFTMGGIRWVFFLDFQTKIHNQVWKKYFQIHYTCTCLIYSYHRVIVINFEMKRVDCWLPRWYTCSICYILLTIRQTDNILSEVRPCVIQYTVLLNYSHFPLKTYIISMTLLGEFHSRITKHIKMCI